MSKIKIRLLLLLLGLDFYGCIKIVNYIRKLVMYIYTYLEAMGISYLSCLRLSINDILSQQCSAFHIQAVINKIYCFNNKGTSYCLLN